MKTNTLLHPPQDKRETMAPFSSWPTTGGRPAGYFLPPLDQKAVAFYREHGFLVLEEAFDPSEIDELNNETLRICRGRELEVDGVEPASDEETPDDILRRYLCIHFPHRISETMAKFVTHPIIAEVLTQLIGPDVKCMQSMLFIKAAGKPGQAWHQDEIFIPTRDRSLTGGWIAQDDATVENGCLWVIPGSHKPGILWDQKKHDDRRFDCTQETYGYPYTEADEVPVEVKAGSIVFFNGYLLHRSLPNRAASGYRRVLVNHYMSAQSLLPWFATADNGPGVGAADFRDVLMIAGKDPYADRGYTRLSRAFVRPSGEGGCAPKGE